MDDILHYLYVKLYYISGFSGYSAPVSAKNHKNIIKIFKKKKKINLHVRRREVSDFHTYCNKRLDKFMLNSCTHLFKVITVGIIKYIIIL